MKNIHELEKKKTWICGANPPQIEFWKYAKAKATIGGFATPGGRICTDLLIQHMLRRIEDLEAALSSSLYRCCACGVAITAECEVRFNSNQHYCPNCALGIVREYQSDEGLTQKMIDELAESPFHPFGFFSGHAPSHPEWPSAIYWAEIVKECPEVGLKYIALRNRRT